MVAAFFDEEDGMIVKDVVDVTNDVRFMAQEQISCWKFQYFQDVQYNEVPMTG